jgi:GxxExxY protein
MHENEISYLIRGAAFKVYHEFGPGLLESVYEKAMALELVNQAIHFERQKGIPVYFDGQDLGVGFRADLIVENKVIVEIKSVEHLHPIHHKQLLTYLRLTDLKLGLLINFNADRIQNGIFRKVNGL